MIDEKSIIPKSADDSTYVQMFYKAYHKLLYREARKYLNSTEDIDDIVQDSVVKLIENLDTIRSLSPKRQVSYAVTVTRNLAINLLIRQKRITLESLDELEPYVKDSNDLEAQVGHHEKLQLFHTVWKQNAHGHTTAFRAKIYSWASRRRNCSRSWDPSGKCAYAANKGKTNCCERITKKWIHHWN